jgi:hypothetical protein
MGGHAAGEYAAVRRAAVGRVERRAKVRGEAPWGAPMRIPGFARALLTGRHLAGASQQEAVVVALGLHRVARSCDLLLFILGEGSRVAVIG